MSLYVSARRLKRNELYYELPNETMVEAASLSYQYQYLASIAQETLSGRGMK